MFRFAHPREVRRFAPLGVGRPYTISIRAPAQGATPYIAQPDNSKHNMYALITRFYFGIALTQVKISAKRPALFCSLSLRTQNKGGDDYILIHAPA